MSEETNGIVACPICRKPMESSEEFQVCTNPDCVIDELDTVDWHAITEKIKRAYYDGIIHAVNVGNPDGTTGALIAAERYVEPLP